MRRDFATPPPQPQRERRGRRKARARWFKFLSELDPQLLDVLGFGQRNTILRSSAVSDEDRKKLDRYVRDFSEMVGFWISWHSLGGFDRLEDNGWHRATIYLKLKKFRDLFAAHPDEFEFDWIHLDLEKSWHDDFMDRFGVNDGPDDAAGAAT